MAATGEPLLITKHGKPVAELKAPRPPRAKSLIGLHKGHRILGDPIDRLIVATALERGAALLTADEGLLGWKHTLERSAPAEAMGRHADGHGMSYKQRAPRACC